MMLVQRPTTLSGCGKKTEVLAMRQVTIISKSKVKTLEDLDVLEDSFEDAIIEALEQGYEIEVSITAEFNKAAKS
tara:strand:- start:257 stop:481 length:225 start_codon:yes stop_codon:yes gene_type:complete